MSKSLSYGEKKLPLFFFFTQDKYFLPLPFPSTLPFAVAFTVW